jgi:hypothetical protein
LYIDARSTPEQQHAIELIYSGQAGGGIFELFRVLVAKALPPKIVPIEFHLDCGKGRVRVADILEMDSELLSYPDGTTIRPEFSLPHGIEFKTALATNARKWWVRDEDLLGTYQDKYAAVATVKFTQEGCVG